MATAAIVLAAGLLVGAVLTSGGGPADGTGLVDDAAVPGVAEVGSLAPDFVLATTGGRRMAFADTRGAPVVVTFWASWCIPCRKEMPLLQEALDARPGAFRVVAIAWRNVPSDDETWLAAHGITIPSLQDPDFEVARAYGVRGIPQTFFIDADRVIRDRVFGITSRDALAGPLDALLAGRGE